MDENSQKLMSLIVEQGKKVLVLHKRINFLENKNKQLETRINQLESKLQKAVMKG